MNALFSHTVLTQKKLTYFQLLRKSKEDELLNACESTLQDYFLIIRNAAKEFPYDKEAVTFLKK